MARPSVILGVLAASVGSAIAASSGNATGACTEIQNTISQASDVYYPVNIAHYYNDTKHWFGSSSQSPACVVEAGSPEDVAIVLQVVGASDIPFAVSSGGHSCNQGFSSTQGVHISLARFKQVDLSEDSSVVTLGFGLIWSDVYTALANSGVNVVGGRVPGPGVGGFALGGGYSWKTNQHGLTVDTVKSYNVVLPNGTITTASQTQNADLYWALKGGLNRFGVVTSAEFYTHPQPSTVWGGLRIYSALSVPALLNATAAFYEQNQDPKAQIITTLDADITGVSALVLFFYDGPSKPASFDLFDGILATLDGTGPKSFVEFIYSFPSYLVSNVRGTFATFSTSALTDGFLEAVSAEAQDIGQVSALHSGTMVSYDIEPFTQYGQHATDSAWPHGDSLLPLNFYFAWTDPTQDAWWYGRITQSIETLKQVARSEGIYQDSFNAYSNYATANSSAQELYGPANAARLRALRDKYDPQRVMDLTGGFVI